MALSPERWLFQERWLSQGARRGRLCGGANKFRLYVLLFCIFIWLDKGGNFCGNGQKCLSMIEVIVRGVGAVAIPDGGLQFRCARLRPCRLQFVVVSGAE